MRINTHSILGEGYLLLKPRGFHDLVFLRAGLGITWAFARYTLVPSCFIQRISLTGFPAQSVGSSQQLGDVLDVLHACRSHYWNVSKQTTRHVYGWCNSNSNSCRDVAVLSAGGTFLEPALNLTVHCCGREFRVLNCYDQKSLLIHQMKIP
ncbi:hypothetical protein Tco_0879025 [Tanacetum coccineum]